MEKQLNGVMSHEMIRQNLDQIRSFIEIELAEKKETIKEQVAEIEELKKMLQQKDLAISMFEANTREFRETAEGNRQLINKLLGDISRLQNDIDWYKRTYEKRSLLGVLREKLAAGLGKKNKS
jgi:septal ring factor EnvC (AmiA/AmiB activator)